MVVCAFRRFVEFSGSVGPVNAAFHTQIHEYMVDGVLHHANVSTTMDLCTQAFSEDARQAQSHVIDMVRKAPLSAQKPAVCFIVQSCAGRKDADRR
jgi:hypothetical protein